MLDGIALANFSFQDTVMNVPVLEVLALSNRHEIEDERPFTSPNMRLLLADQSGNGEVDTYSVLTPSRISVSCSLPLPHCQ